MSPPIPPRLPASGDVPSGIRRVVVPPGGSTLWHLLGFLLLVVVFVYMGLWLVSPVMGPAAISLLIAYLANPLVQRLERRGMKREVVIALIIGGLTLLMVVGLLIVLPFLVREVQLLLERGPAYAERAVAAANTLLIELGSRVGLNLEGDLNEVLARNDVDMQMVASRLMELTRNLSKGFFVGTANFIGFILSMTLVPVFAWYLMLEFEQIKASSMELVPRIYQKTVSEHARQINVALSGFIRGQILVCGILAVLYTLGLLLVGIDFAVLIGVTAGILFIVPYVGTLLGMAAGGVMALVEFGFDWHLIGVALAFAIPQALETYVVTPRVMSQSVGLNPVVVVSCLVIAATYFGIWGMVLAVPVTAGLLIVTKTLHARYLQSNFYRWTPPHMDQSPGEKS